jgi:general stress protein YciG
MSGKKNTAWKTTMLKKLGSEEAVSKFMAERGHTGGSKSCKKGFASMPKEKVQAAGRKGGQISRRITVWGKL